jgi:hypothetical protein
MFTILEQVAAILVHVDKTVGRTVAPRSVRVGSHLVPGGGLHLHDYIESCCDKVNQARI